MIYLKLFFSFFKIGLFSIGGGYAVLPIIKSEIVLNQGLITLSEFSDIITISEMTPGPISINAATFVGTTIGGVFGAVICTFAFVLPSFMVVLTLAYFYFKYQNIDFLKNVLGYLKPVVIGIIASAGISIFITAILGTNQQVDTKALLIFVLSFVLMLKSKINFFQMIPISAILGIILYNF